MSFATYKPKLPRVFAEIVAIDDLLRNQRRSFFSPGVIHNNDEWCLRARMYKEVMATRKRLSDVVGLSAKDASILITTPKGWKPPRKFPRGWIARFHEDGSRTRYLPAGRTLAWLTRNGLVNTATEERQL